MELNWVQFKALSSLWHWGLGHYRLGGIGGGDERRRSPECPCQGGLEDSRSCRGGRWGTGGQWVPGVGRPILLNHLSQPFGEVEVGSNGEEALCGGAERRVCSFHRRERSFKIETESLALRGSQFSGTGGAAKKFF